jgi:hypothetical protein
VILNPDEKYPFHEAPKDQNQPEQQYLTLAKKKKS